MSLKKYIPLTDHIRCLEEKMDDLTQNTTTCWAYLGLSVLVKTKNNSPGQLQILEFIKGSARFLDNLTGELTEFLYKKVLKIKTKDLDK